MPGGGSKPGERRGGRKSGTPNKASAARQAQAAAEGVMPCEVMLANMRFAYGRALELQALLGEIDTHRPSDERSQSLGNSIIGSCKGFLVEVQPPSSCIAETS
jgi:hypothetical protein